ncbi:hypothetical protein Ahy_A02g008548 [Arachis hypogaea]|uniref:Replication factor A C-terminal domain-containing protein n=1 Tax=Arachis hypogaea TaxID=3818 RepID=A0A445EEL0_ARAHY|nr:hypothetical protein Ahy_A02g008548 [Arachis hypogaea]
MYNGWWYKGCKLCYRALKEDESSYYCMFYDSFPNTHVPRFCVQVRVCDDTDNVAFVIYDKEASHSLCTSASDLRSSKDDIPDEINSFRRKKFLFKISVKLDDMNENMPLENSEIQSAQSEFDVTPIVQLEFPSIFYRRYKDQLSERVFFIDLNENLVKLIIGMCQSARYILFAFDNLIRLFGLENGGWLKLIFVGENVFIITKVKDVSMFKKHLPYPPTKLFLDHMCHLFVNNNVTDFSLNVFSLQSNPNIVIDISSDSSMNSDVPPFLDQFFIDGVMSDMDVIYSIPPNGLFNDGVNTSLVSINNPLNNFHQGQQHHQPPTNSIKPSPEEFLSNGSKVGVKLRSFSAL